MRGLLPGLDNPFAFGPALPGLYQEDELVQRFLSAFDDVLAPVVSTLDNIDAYLDPALAPVDFLGWLARWLGLALDDNWPEDRQRALVAGAAALYGWRGTAKGLAQHVALYTGTEPQIEETGAVGWSPTPGSPLPGSNPPHVTVRVRAEPGSLVDTRRIEAIVAAAKPAHVTHRVEVLSS